MLRSAAQNSCNNICEVVLDGCLNQQIIWDVEIFLPEKGFHMKTKLNFIEILIIIAVNVLAHSERKKTDLKTVNWEHHFLRMNFAGTIISSMKLRIKI